MNLNHSKDYKDYKDYYEDALRRYERDFGKTYQETLKTIVLKAAVCTIIFILGVRSVL